MFPYLKSQYELREKCGHESLKKYFTFWLKITKINCQAFHTDQ